ncbi:MAG: helix-turn-helix domain-containing protein [Acidimicrobiia bacterium]|nr:helix-turn-helix domain-containing protein [Acidimicrobiia bacterium]
MQATRRSRQGPVDELVEVYGAFACMYRRGHRARRVATLVVNQERSHPNIKYRVARRVSVALFPCMERVIAIHRAPLLLTVREAATTLSIGRSTLYELISAAEIEVVHIGRSVRIPASELDAFVDRRSEAVAPDWRASLGVAATRRG